MLDTIARQGGFSECEVVITAPDPGWLKDFSRKLVEQRLCASLT